MRTRLGTSLTQHPHVLPREAALILGCGAEDIHLLVCAGQLVNSSPDRWTRIDVAGLESLVTERIRTGRLAPSAAELLAGIVRDRALTAKDASETACVPDAPTCGRPRCTHTPEPEP
jgi:hypothetical protein